MRLRNSNSISKEYLKEKGVIIEPTIISSLDLYVELGSGKGSFITKKAQDNPNLTFVAMEIEPFIANRIVNKRDDLGLTNLHIICADATNLLSFFKHESINELYLNFSDPWPKRKQHKFRLTYPTRLVNYHQVMKNNAKLIFKTDHSSLFEDSLIYLKPYFEIQEVNRDCQSEEYQTEYEIKFSPIHKINKVIAIKTPNLPLPTTSI